MTDVSKTKELQGIMKKRRAVDETTNDDDKVDLNTMLELNETINDDHILLKLNYEIIKTYLTKQSVENPRIVNPRRVHISQVNSIYQALIKGKHFDGVFVVNKIDNQNRFIDGNHRLIALKRFFKKYPFARPVPVYFATYNNLNEKQEREIFTRWNLSVTQSTDDFINSYKETIPMYNRFISELPCGVYGSYNKMKLRDLINAYSASFEKPYHGGESKTKMNLIHYIQTFKDSDMDLLVKNFNIVREIFDTENKKDWRKLAAFKNIIFRALYYLVANNLDTLGEAYLKRRMRTALADRTILDDYRRYSGRRASVDAYHAFKALLNDTPSDKKFV